MLAPADDFGIKLFSDRMVPQSAGFSAWNRLLNKWLLGAHGRQLHDSPFHISVRLRVLPEIRFGWGSMGACAYDRSRDVVAEDNDDVFLFLNLGGTFVAANAGREIELRPGDGYAMACSEPSSYARPQGGRVLCLRVRRDAIQPLVRNLDEKLSFRIPRESEALRMLGAYLRLNKAEPLTSEPLRRAAAHHIHDLLALTLGANGCARETAEVRGLHAARFRAAKAVIRRDLCDPGLSAETVAGRLGISPRSLQRLFEREGLTFSNFVCGERLALAYAGLGETNGRSIAEIAMETGFGDISYFNRKFRARYHAAPSEVRNATHRD